MAFALTIVVKYDYEHKKNIIDERILELEKEYNVNKSLGQYLTPCIDGSYSVIDPRLDYNYVCGDYINVSMMDNNYKY